MRLLPFQFLVVPKIVANLSFGAQTPLRTQHETLLETLHNTKTFSLYFCTCQCIIVDGFISCNEQVMGTVLKENLNGSQPSGKTNTSGESTHMTFNFPFVEGNPFTAALWVGPEGFHMTVNGRHETSFAYREKHEPWLVSGVKVGGGLQILSALANGLPQLKSPPVSRKRLNMLIGVSSTGNNFERRMALRKSWMQYKVVRSGDVAVRFFIGLQKNKQVNIEIWKESQMYGDIQLMPFVDYYFSLVTLK
uniref:Hexosyltransferase n=1 Tax=Nelumbo nucifera TaxID=4432 RepID=A0A822ZD59_NELNU|nr:TPA_asm: hypothetical protein HUJ06_013831 [Nelumbo nucifera]